MTDFAITPRSILPGRERYDIPAIRKNDVLAEKIHQALHQVADIFKVVANPITGRVLVLFHPQQYGQGEIAKLLKQALNGEKLESAIVEKPATGVKQQLKGIVDDNELYEIIKFAENSSELRNKAMKLTVAHSTLKLVTPMFLGLMVSSVLFPIETLANLGLSTGVQLAGFSGLFVASKVLESKVGMNKNKAWNKYSAEIDKNLTHKVMKHVQALPISYVDNEGAEKLMNIVKGDTDAIKRFLNHTPSEFTDKATTIAIGSGIIAAIAPFALLLAFVPVPFISKYTKEHQKALQKHNMNNGQYDEQFNQLLSNNFNGLSTVKSFTAEDQEIERLDQAKHTASDHNEELANINAYYGNLNEFLFMTGMAIPLIYNCINAMVNNLNMTLFMIQNGTVPSLLTASAGLEYGKSLYRDANAAAARLNKLLAQPIEQYQTEQAALTNPFVQGELVFDNLSFGYNTQRILNGININIPPQGKIAFVGPTGSGKSTLMKLLLRFYSLNDGQITIGGQDITKIDLRQLRQSIGLVSQDPFLFNGTIYENLLYGRPDATYDEIVAACKIAQAYDFISKTENGFDTQIGERGSKLSGGQRQRLSIARAVLKNASILILDEATSAVDNETEAAIRESVESISKHATVIIIAHRLSTIRYVDTIYHLKDGSITESGSHTELLKKDGDYASLWRLQTAQQTQPSIQAEKELALDTAVTIDAKAITTEKETSNKEKPSVIEMDDTAEVIIATKKTNGKGNGKANGVTLN